MSDPKPQEMTPEWLATMRTQSGLFHGEVTAVFEHIDAITARLEKAERTIERIQARDPIAPIGNGDMLDAGWVLMEELTAQKARTDAAEKKLRVLVEAWDALCAANAAWSPTGPQACRDAVPVARDRFHAAIGEARGES